MAQRMNFHHWASELTGKKGDERVRLFQKELS